MKKYIKTITCALMSFMASFTMAADESFDYQAAIDNLQPIPFRKLTYNMGMYNAEQIDKMIGGISIENLFEWDNVIIGKYAYGNWKEFVTTEDGKDVVSPEVNLARDQSGNVAIGYAATNLSNHSTAVGKWSKTGLFDTTAIGFRSRAMSHHSTAIDGIVEEPGFFNTAIKSTIGSGMYNVAIGTAHATGDGIQANGSGTVVDPLKDTQYCVVIGAGSRIAPGVSCGVAIGHDCVVTTNNQVVIGGIDVTKLDRRVATIEAQLSPADENSAAARLVVLEEQMSSIQAAAEALMNSLNSDTMGTGARDAEPMTLEKFLQVIIDTKKK